MTFLLNRLEVRSLVAVLLVCLACWSGAPAQSVTLIQQVNQAPAAPIVWQAPEAIPFGTPLSALQLNATSATAGAFTYQPALGTMLPSGTSTLSVVLSPLNPNYMTASSSVSITVIPPGSSSFTITPLSASSPDNPVVLEAGLPATLQVAIAPVGDFHQPITLSCSVPLVSWSCFFSPTVIRPTTSPVQVKLTFAPVHEGRGSQSSLNMPPWSSSAPKGLLPSVTSSALFGILVFRRRLKNRILWPARVIMWLALPLFTMLFGCGVGRFPFVEQVEIRGSSLVETHISYIYVANTPATSAPVQRRLRTEGGQP